MRCRFVKRESSKRLVLIFADWGCDWRIFAPLTLPEYDIAVVWDYSELTFSWKRFMGYGEICLVGWGFGVFAASITVHEIEPLITSRIAVNGTLTPLDDLTGMSPSRWRSLENTLSPTVWRRYMQSWFVNDREYRKAEENLPRRTIADIRNELIQLETHTIFHAEQMSDWDMAIVSVHDNVFPVASQTESWHPKTIVRYVDSSHLPDMQFLLENLILPKKHIRDAYVQSAASSGESHSALRAAGRHLLRAFDSVWGDGPVIGNIVEASLDAECSVISVISERTDRRAKLSLWTFDEIRDAKFERDVHAVSCDAEMQIKRHPTGSAGFVFSVGTLRWCNSPRRFLNECQRVLVPGGCLAIVCPTPVTLDESKCLPTETVRMLTKRNWKSIFPRGIELLTIEEVPCQDEAADCRLLVIIGRKYDTE